MSNFYDVQNTIEKIEENLETLEEMQDNWNNGDIYDQSWSSPDNQYLIEQEIDDLWRSLHKQVSEIVENI